VAFWTPFAEPATGWPGPGRRLWALQQRLKCALGHSGGTESAILLEAPETAAKAEAQLSRPGLTMLRIMGHDLTADGSRRVCTAMT